MQNFSHQQFQEVSYMRRALALARRGSYATISNPLVGCVLVKDNRIIGEGWHAGDGTLHAEAAAMEQAQQHAAAAIKGAAAYVTLEPCCHTGKQPPCTESLIAAGIGKVVAATQDPHQLVQGKGLAALRRAGIAVTTGLLKQDAEALNKSFFYRHRVGLPWLVAKLAISLDGRIAAEDGSSAYISCAASRMDAMRMRARSQAILTTSNTVIADNPQLNVRGIHSTDIEAASGITQPHLWIIDRKGKVDPSSRVFTPQAHTSYQSRYQQYRDVVWLRPPLQTVEARDHVEIMDTANTADSLRQLLHTMAARGIHQVITECGGKLIGSLLQAKLVNELVIYQAPLLLGNRGIPMTEIAIGSMEQAIGLRLAASTTIGTDTKSTYIRTD